MLSSRTLPQKIGLTSLFAIVAVATSPLGVALIMWLQVAPLPRSFHFTISNLGLYFPLLTLVGLAILTVGPIVTFGKAARKKRPLWLWAGFWISYWGCWWISTVPLSKIDEWRRPGLTRITQNARPLIVAIEKYKTVNGSYPPNLAVLSPRFITQLPYTGAPGYAEFHYRIAIGSSRFKKYEVSVRTPKGLANFDYFFYWPDRSYPPLSGNESIERIKDWAYLHE